MGLRETPADAWFQYRKTKPYTQMQSMFLGMHLEEKIELAELLRDRLLLIRGRREKSKRQA